MADVGKVKQKFEERYPDLAFLAKHFSANARGDHGDVAAFDAWFAEGDFEILYVVGLAEVPKRVIAWLEEKEQRALVFIENSLSAIASFPDDSLWDHPQIHLHYSEEDPIETLASTYPTDRIAIYTQGKDFNAEKLMRRSFAISALYSDVLYGHAIYRNVRHHFLHMDGVFDANKLQGAFQGIPLIICGGGPSLEDAIQDLKAVRSKAIICAGGAAIPALAAMGVQPHFGLALDPNEEELFLLSKAKGFDAPLLFSPRLHYKVRDLFQGPFGYLRTDTGGLFEHWLEKELGISDPAIGPDLGSEAFSVTTLAVSLSHAFGCSSVYFCGVDLAYTGGKRYPSSLAAHDKRGTLGLEMPLTRTNGEGEEVETALKWVMEADAIGAFAAKHHEIQFIQTSKMGLEIPGTQQGSLSDLFKEPSQDLDQLIRAKISNFPLSIDPKEAIDRFDASMKRCAALCTQILKEYESGVETGKCVLYKHDLLDEIAYAAVLDGIDGALSHLMERYYLQGDVIQREIAKYKELQRQIQEYIL